MKILLFSGKNSLKLFISLSGCFSLQKTPIKQLETQIPQSGFYSSPQIDKSIWGQPAPPTIQPPPGFSGIIKAFF
jgi:hypothetical protein